MSLLAILAAGLGSQVRMALSITQRMERQLHQTHLAAAALPEVARVLEADPTPQYDGLVDDWAVRQGWFAEVASDEARIRLAVPSVEEAGTSMGLVDEERKLPLNTAPVDVLQRLVLRAGGEGMSGSQATVVAESIADWRDEDQEKRPDGAEDDFYLSRSPSYECKDAPFENVEELWMVRGMTPALYAGLAPAVTVHGIGTLNINTAEAEVVRALGLSKTGLEGLLAYRVGEDGQAGTGDDRVIGSTPGIPSELEAWLPVEDQPVLNELMKAELLGVKSDEFHVAFEASVGASSSPTRVECVISRAGQVRRWSEQE